MEITSPVSLFTFIFSFFYPFTKKKASYLILLMVCAMAAQKKKAVHKESESPMKLFYIFYSQERWDNWMKSLQEADFGNDPDSEDLPFGLSILSGFNQDICVAVLKIIKLYQNNRFNKEETLGKLQEVGSIVMNQEVPEELADVIAYMQDQLVVVFSSCTMYLAGEYESTEIKDLIKDGRACNEDEGEKTLDLASKIGAHIINGKSCCGRYIKDNMEPTMFNEWLIQIEMMSEAFSSLKGFDEQAGEE